MTFFSKLRKEYIFNSLECVTTYLHIINVQIQYIIYHVLNEIHFSLVLWLSPPLVCVVRAEVGKAASLCGRQVTVDCSTTTVAQMATLTPSTTSPLALPLKQESPPTSASPAPAWWPSLWQGSTWEAHYPWLLCVYHLTHLTTVFILNEVVRIHVCASSLWALRSLLESHNWCDIYSSLPSDLGNCWPHTEANEC